MITFKQFLNENNIPEGSFPTRLHTVKDIRDYGSPVYGHGEHLDDEQLANIVNKSSLHHISIDHPQFKESRKYPKGVLSDLHPKSREYFKKGLENGNFPPATAIGNEKKWELTDGRHRAATAILMGKTHMPVRIISPKSLKDNA